MGKDSAIEWTHHTFNPWWGCEKVSPACTRCYAETFAKRVGQKVWGGAESPRRFFGSAHWGEPLLWDAEAERAGERRRVFCASMADVFEDRQDLRDERPRLWTLIEQTSHLDWLLLTKRPENIASMLPADWVRWPRPNVWLGTTVENQEWADKRIPHLLRVPAAVHFLSVEPLLGYIDVAGAVPCGYHCDPEGAAHVDHGPNGFLGCIDWIIVGGESGHGARPLHPEWVRQIRRQALLCEVPFFFKQWGEWLPFHHRYTESGAKCWPNLDLNNHSLVALDQDGTIGRDVPGAWIMQKVGKKAAGRLLDGHEWNDVPILEGRQA